MVYPQNFEDKIGFTRIRELLKKKCLSNMGRDRVDAIRFSDHHEFIVRLLAQTDEMKQICELSSTFPVDNYIDLREFLSKIRIEGTFLIERELFDLKRALETVRALISFFKQSAEEEYLELKQLIADVEAFPELIQIIDQILDKFGKIKDNASPELKEIRQELFSKQNGISKRIQAIMANAQREGWVDTDLGVTVRDGKMLIPVAANHKRKIKGFIHDESATGKTVFIEPVEIVELNNEVRELEFAERREIMRILMAVTDRVRPYLPALANSHKFLGTMDFIHAKALLALDFEAIKPRVHNHPEIDWHNAVHPLLQQTLAKEGKSVVPLYLKLDKTDRILLISGPNAGGKSICLKTVGILQYMLQCGLLVPMHSHSNVGIFKKLFIDIGDEQSLENDLSTYSSHLVNMRHFSRNAQAETLFLIDEFGTGTEPLLGGAIAEAILEKLNEQQAFGLITTHYTNLKHFASATPGIVNGAMQYDTQKMQPLFILKIGKPGSSFAFEIARNIGLSPEILALATAKIGQEHVDYDKNLKAVDKERQKLEHKQRHLNRKQRDLDELILKYAKDRDEALREKKRAVKEAKHAAEVISDTINKRIENTIAEIKKANAEKDKTRELRTSLAEFTAEVAQQQAEDEARIERKMQRLQQKANRAKRTQEQPNKTDKAAPKTTPEDNEIRVGDWVQLKGQQGTSEVLAIDNKNITITLGQLKTTVKLDRLIKISRNEQRKIQRAQQSSSSTANYTFEARLDFKSSIDLRGQRGDAALLSVQDFIDEAIVSEAKSVRILHGKGDGILRQLIRDYLRTVPYVSRAYDERIEQGGTGITLVDFDYD